MSRLLLLLVAAAAIFMTARPGTPAAAETLIVQTEMRGASHVPPVETVVWGFVRFFFNDDRSAAEYTVDVKGIPGGRVLGADIHRGGPTESGPVVFHLADGGFIVTNGEMTFSADDLGEMLAGKWYVSLKTADHPEGAIRGQIALPAGFLPASAQPPAPAPVGGTPSIITPPSAGDAGLRP